MKEKLRQIFAGRQGMDELSKLLFWLGIALFMLALVLGGAPGSLLLPLALMSVVFAFVRAFSRNLPLRETENLLSRVYQGSLSLMVSAFTKKQALSRGELEELYAILKEAEGKNDA